MTVTPIAGHNPVDVPEHPTLYWVLWLSGAALVVVLLFVVAPLAWSTQLLDFGVTFDSGPTAVLVAILFLVFSFAEVRAEEVAGAYCYGKALKRFKSGPHFVPFGLMQVKRAPRTVQQFQAPGEPEDVFKGDDREPLPEGKVRTIRTVTRAPRSDETEILDAQMTMDLSFVVQFVFEDIFDFISNFGTKAEVERQLRDIGESTLAEEVTQYTPRTFIESLTTVNEKLVTATQMRFLQSGVRILSVRLISPDISHRVSSALAGIPEAKAEAQQAAARAEGARTKLIKEGEGAASAAASMLKAQADGRKTMMDTLRVNGETVLASEAALSLSEKTVVVVGAEGGMRDMMGLVKGAQAALNTNPKGTTP